MSVHQYSVQQTWLGQTCYSMLYYDHVQEDDAVKQAVVDALRAAWATNLLTHLTPNWSLIQVLVRNVGLPGTLSQTFIPTAGTVVGTSGSDSLATQLALLVVSKSPAVPPNRTRTYLAGFTEGGLTNSQFISTALTAATAWGNAVRQVNGGTAGTLIRQAVEWNRALGQVVDSNPVTTVQSFAVPATQRRRRIGVGI